MNRTPNETAAPAVSTGTGCDDTTFDEFAARNWRPLMRAGWLLSGDWAAAEDLVQMTLSRAWLSWARVVAADEPDAYARRMLMNEYFGQRRRRWRDEIPSETLPERSTSDSSEQSVRRLALLAALAELPPRQRAAVVLRYFADLSVEQVAHALGCSTGNVKSQTARALHKLRASRHFDQAMTDLKELT